VSVAAAAGAALPINLFAPPDDPDELLPLEPLLELPELDPEDEDDELPLLDDDELLEDDDDELLPEEVVATPFVASQYTRAPAVTAVPVPVALAMSKTPWTAKAPLVFAGIACKAIPIRSPCNTTAPAATSEDGV